MIAAPWYLLAAGIVVLIVGWILAAVQRSSAGQTYIDPRMSDEEIAETLKGGQGSRLASYAVITGMLMILASIIWRIARFFL